AAVPKRKAGSDQTIAQMLAARHADAPVVQERAAAPRGREEIVADGIVNHTLRHDAFVRQRDRYAVLRKPMEEVRRPVERIDDPEIFGIDVLVASGSFFGENRMTRVRCMQRIDDRALGLDTLHATRSEEHTSE